MKLKNILLVALLPACAIIDTGCGKVGGKKPVVVTFAYPANPETNRTYREIVRRFNEKNPDIKIRIMDIPSNGYSAKILTMVAGGVSPDVIWTHEMLYHQYVKKGILEDLTPYIEKSESFRLDDCYSNVVDLYRFKGRQYGLPFTFSPIVLWYNKDLFDEAGVEYPDASWDWNDFLEAAKKLTRDKNGDGRIDQFGYVMSMSPNRWGPWIWQNGGRMMSEDGGRCLFDMPETVEAIRFYADLMNKHHVAPTMMELQDQSTGDLFRTGKVAMMSEARWGVPKAREEMRFNWDVAPLPKGRMRATANPTAGWSIISRGKHKEAAWRFVEFLLSPECQRMPLQGGGIPILKSVAEEKIGTKSDAPPAHDGIFLDAVEYVRLEAGIADDAVAVPLAEELEKIFRGMVTPKEGCEAIARKANKELRERTTISDD